MFQQFKSRWLPSTGAVSDSITWYVSRRKVDEQPIHNWAKKTTAFAPSYKLVAFGEDSKLIVRYLVCVKM